jgi:hypothetical protein
MFLNGDFLKIVAFLGSTSPEAKAEYSIDLKGTGFFVAKQMGQTPGEGGIFLVTAKHVALQLGTEVTVLMNLKPDKGGGAGAIHITKAPWLFHSDASIDIALLRMPPTILEFDAKWLVESDFLTDADIHANVMAVGNEVQIIGLFSRVPGKASISPVVRTGNVAMFPPEKIPSQIGDIEAYLIEARSLGGMSGSPVFCRSTIAVNTDVGQMCGTGPGKLMGVVHGHWGIPVQDEAAKAQHVNLGLAIVIPAKLIPEIIDQNLSK